MLNVTAPLLPARDPKSRFVTDSDSNGFRAAGGFCRNSGSVPAVCAPNQSYRGATGATKSAGNRCCTGEPSFGFGASAGHARGLISQVATSIAGSLGTQGRFDQIEELSRIDEASVLVAVGEVLLIASH